VSTAGDVNGDGFSDVIIGARWYDNGQTDEGRAHVYHGSAAGLSAAAAWTAESNQAGALFGTSVATAGDVNGDGFSDVLVGAPAFANGQTREGRGYVYHGSALGLSVVASWTAEPDQAFAEFGNAVATAGDVNGDGFADVIIGAHLYDNGEADEGRAILYYGNAGAGRIVRPRQQRTDGMTPIAPLGRSDGQTEFRIRAVMLSIYGRTRLQMEHEVKSLGMVFDGTGTVPGTFTDSGSSGAVEFNRLVTGLTPGRPYHWRVRARYDLAKTPFQRHGPWLQVPVNGWNETDLRMAAGITALDPAAAPRAARLLASPRPNPFAEAGEVAYMLPRAGAVRLAVYDAAGRERAVLVAGRQDAGPRVARWDGRDSRGHKLPAGVYFVRLDFEGRTESEKLVIAR
jgi:hypothetical protein